LLILKFRGIGKAEADDITTKLGLLKTGLQSDRNLKSSAVNTFIKKFYVDKGFRNMGQ